MTAGQPTTPAVENPPARPQEDSVPDAAELVLEDRFSIVPVWVLDADIGDCALRLYAVLLRYGNSTDVRMPSRPPSPAGCTRSPSTPSTGHCSGRRPAHRSRRELGGPDLGIGSTEHWRRRHEDLLADCGVISSDAWDGIVAQVHAVRQAAGQPLTRWSAHIS